MSTQVNRLHLLMWELGLQAATVYLELCFDASVSLLKTAFRGVAFVQRSCYERSIHSLLKSFLLAFISVRMNAPINEPSIAGYFQSISPPSIFHGECLTVDTLSSTLIALHTKADKAMQQLPVFDRFILMRLTLLQGANQSKTCFSACSPAVKHTLLCAAPHLW